MMILIRFGASVPFLPVLRVITHGEGEVSSRVTHQTLHVRMHWSRKDGAFAINVSQWGIGV